MASSVRSPPGDRNDAQPAGAVNPMSRARHARRSWARRGSRGTAVFYAGAVHLGLITVVVSEYDPAIGFFVDGLGFELVEDSPALTGDGRPKRWVVVRPPGAVTGLLLARADGQDQVAAVGKQAAGRVGFFLQVEDFDAAYTRMASAGVQFLTAPRTEPYGHIAVFADIAGNKWDLIGPAT
jgi:catechol 2,3-dioxygenase-like lactoylglutathione lyase family enzyme